MCCQKRPIFKRARPTHTWGYNASPHTTTTTSAAGRTGAVLLGPGLRHLDLPVHDGLVLQDVLVVAVARGRLLLGRAARPGAVAAAIRTLDLREDGGLVEERQVALEVEVRVQAVVHGVPEALVVALPHGAAAAVLHAVLLGRRLIRPSTA